MPNCPLCQAKSGKYYNQVNQYQIYRCQDCGLEFTYPLPSNKELTEFYSTYQEQYFNQTVKRLNSLEYIDFMCSNGINRQAKLLDYGCGEGDFVKVWGNSAVGYDLKDRNFFNKYGNKTFDIITFFGVLEHLATPLEDMQLLVRRLNPNGYIVLMVIVNDSGIPYRYKPPEHLTYWTSEALQILCNKCDLELIVYESLAMYETVSVFKEKMGRRLSPLIREKIMPLHDTDDLEYVLVPTNNIITIGKVK